MWSRLPSTAVILILVGIAAPQLFESKRKYPTAQDLPFLKNASDQTKKDVFEVIGETQLSMDEKEDIIADIVAKDSDDVKATFEKFRTEVKSRRTKKFEAAKKARSKLGTQAAAADEYIESIVKNGDLHPEEKRRMVADIVNNLADNARKELFRVHAGLKRAVRQALRAGRRYQKGKKNELTVELKPIQLSNDETHVKI